MVKELELVIKEIEKLSEKDQRELGKNWLDEIKWQTSYKNSECELSMLANEALVEYKEGKTEDL